MVTQKRAALITGGASKLGSAISEFLAVRKYDLVIHCNAARRAADDLCAFLGEKYDVDACVFPRDLLRRGSCEELLSFSLERFPHLNAIVNNASIFVPDNLWDSNEDVFLNHYNIHVKVPFFLSKYLLLKKNCSEDRISIINVIDEFIKTKTARKYFSYLLSKKAMRILSEMMEEYIALNGMNATIGSVYPEKISYNDEGLDMDSVACERISRVINEISGILDK